MDDHEVRVTPMVNIWVVVVCTMLATVLFGFIWHTTGMSETRLANIEENKVVSNDLVRLTTYRDQLKQKMASTSSATSSAISSSTTTNKTSK